MENTLESLMEKLHHECSNDLVPGIITDMQTCLDVLKMYSKYLMRYDEENS